jgi:hypothetical protein
MTIEGQKQTDGQEPHPPVAIHEGGGGLANPTPYAASKSARSGLP